MKKWIALFLIFAMVLPMCGCGNSGTTAEKGMPAVSSKGLPKWLEGEWINLGNLINAGYAFSTTEPTLFTETAAVFTKDQATVASISAPWKMTGNDISVGDNFLFHPVQIQDITLLELDSAGNTRRYINRRDLDKVFVEVELTTENISDYMEIIDMPSRDVDDFGDVRSEGLHHWFASKAYDNGLLYLADKNLHIEYFVNFSEFAEPTASRTNQLYGGTHAHTKTNGEYNWVDSSRITLGRVTGTVCYVRAEYASVAIEGRTRTLTVLGESSSREIFTLGPVPMDLEKCYY